jgi:hypothetical protein
MIGIFIGVKISKIELELKIVFTARFNGKYLSLTLISNQPLDILFKQISLHT